MHQGGQHAAIGHAARSTQHCIKKRLLLYKTLHKKTVMETMIETQSMVA